MGARRGIPRLKWAVIVVAAALVGLASAAGGGWHAVPAALLWRAPLVAPGARLPGQPYAWGGAAGANGTADALAAQQQRAAAGAAAAAAAAARPAPGGAAAAAAAARAAARARVRAYNAWKNDLLLGSVLPAALYSWLPHPLAVWLRCAGCSIVTYLIPGGAWLAAAAQRGAPLRGPGGLLASPALRNQVGGRGAAPPAGPGWAARRRGASPLRTRPRAAPGPAHAP
jgi:hypothetical protein